MTDPRERSRFDGAVPFLYLALSWILLLPFTARIGRSLPGPRVDTFQTLWNYWWVGKALPEGHTPFFTGELFHPYGADLSYHTLSLLSTSSAALLGNIFSPVTLLGFSLFLAYPIGAWGTYLFTREVTGSRAGAFAAGFVFVFFPHHVDQIYSHLNLTSSHLLPFFLLFLIRLARRPSWKNVVLCALFLALQSYGCFTYMMHGIFFLGTVAVASLIKGGGGRRQSLLLSFAATGFLFLLFTAPLLIAPLQSSSKRGGFQYKKVRPAHSASFETLVSPSVFHPIAGSRVAEGNRAYEHLPRGATAYLGFGMLVLSLIGMLADRKRMWPYAAGAVTFLIFAMGPHLQIRIGDEAGLPLPYALMQKIPLLRFLRVPNRFLIPASLCFAPLVAAGIGYLLRSGPGKVIASLLCALLFVEYLPAPLRTSFITPPPFTEKLAQRREAGAVLDVPHFLGSQASIYMYYQTLHGRPITSGYVSIPPPTQGMIREEAEALRWFCDVEKKREFSGAPEENPVPTLNRLGIGDIVMHKDFGGGENRYAPPGMEWPKESDGGNWYWKYTTVTGSVSVRRMRTYRNKLEEWLGAPYFEDDRIALFAVPEGLER